MNSPLLGTPPALPQPLRDWAWLTVPVPADRAAALRIAVAAVLLIDIGCLYLPNLGALYGPAGFGHAALFDGVFAWPSFRWSLLRVLPPTWGPPALLTVWAAASLFLLVGYRPRLAAAVAWVCAVSFVQVNLFIHNGGDWLKLFLLLMLCFLPSDGRWAVRRNPLASGPALVHPWPLRLMMLQLGLMYFVNGYYKLLGPQWRAGTVMHDVAGNPSWTHFSPDFLPLPDVALRLLTWATLAWELGFPLLVSLKGTRTATLWVGVVFHVASFFHLEIGLFGLYALCFYVPLLPWERWGRA